MRNQVQLHMSFSCQVIRDRGFIVYNANTLTWKINYPFFIAEPVLIYNLNLFAKQSRLQCSTERQRYYEQPKVLIELVTVQCQ